MLLIMMLVLFYMHRGQALYVQWISVYGKTIILVINVVNNNACTNLNKSLYKLNINNIYNNTLFCITVS